MDAAAVLVAELAKHNAGVRRRPKLAAACAESVGARRRAAAEHKAGVVAMLVLAARVAQGWIVEPGFPASEWAQYQQPGPRASGRAQPLHERAAQAKPAVRALLAFVHLLLLEGAPRQRAAYATACALLARLRVALPIALREWNSATQLFEQPRTLTGGFHVRATYCDAVDVVAIGSLHPAARGRSRVETVDTIVRRVRVALQGSRVRHGGDATPRVLLVLLEGLQRGTGVFRVRASGRRQEIALPSGIVTVPNAQSGAIVGAPLIDGMPHNDPRLARAVAGNGTMETALCVDMALNGVGGRVAGYFNLSRSREVGLSTVGGGTLTGDGFERQQSLALSALAFAIAATVAQGDGPVVIVAFGAEAFAYVATVPAIPCHTPGEPSRSMATSRRPPAGPSR